MNIFRSICDYVFKLYNDVIFHRFKRQNTVANFIAETKYMKKCDIDKKIYFFANLLNDLNYIFDDFVDIRANNQTTIKLTYNLINYARIKYISVKYHYVKELIEQKIIKINYIGIKNMIVDGLIKSLKLELYKKFVKMLELANNFKSN